MLRKLAPPTRSAHPMVSPPKTPLPAADQIVWGKHPQHPELKAAQRSAWFGAFRSQPQELSYEVTDIEGTLPAGLLGSTLFRNGPCLFERGNQRVNHFLDGDGSLCRFAFRDDGRVFFESRFVQTAEFQQEKEADTFLFRSTFGTRKPQGVWSNLFELYLKNPANVNTIAWGDKLLALYEAGLPYELEPTTLVTQGPTAMNGQRVENPLPRSRWETLKSFARGKQAITAHPHIDPINNRLITWGWSVQAGLGKSSGLEIEIAEYDAQWQTCCQSRFTLPGAMVNPHDFALTETYYIFCENRLAFSPLPFLLGQKSPAACLKLLTDQPTRIHLVPRPDSSQAGHPPQVFETPPWFSIHQGCAYDQPDGSVVLYSAGWPGSELEQGFLASWSGYAPDFDAIAPTFLWQTTLHPQAGKADHRISPGMENYCIEYPCPNPQVATQPIRYLYMTYSNDIGESSPPIGYLKLDLKTNQKQIWMGNPLSFTGEPVFVPNTKGTKEDEGWLLGMVNDYPTSRSALVILDAQDISAGPICRLWLQHHIPSGLHGCWVSDYYGPDAIP